MANPEIIEKLAALAGQGPIALLKAGIEEVDKFAGMNGSAKQAALKEIMDALVTHKAIPFDTAAVLNNMITNGILTDTVSLIIDASRGRLDVKKAVNVAKDIVQAAVPRSISSAIFSCFMCQPPVADDAPAPVVPAPVATAPVVPVTSDAAIAPVPEATVVPVTAPVNA